MWRKMEVVKASAIRCHGFTARMANLELDLSKL
jgi:hypothetical protein